METPEIHMCISQPPFSLLLSLFPLTGLYPIAQAALSLLSAAGVTGVFFGLDFLLYELSTPDGFSLGEWCPNRRACFLTQDLGLRKLAGGDQRAEKKSRYKHQDGRTQRSTRSKRFDTGGSPGERLGAGSWNRSSCIPACLR